MTAERDLAGGRGLAKAVGRLEPLTIGVDQRDESDRNPEGTPCEALQALEAFLGRGVGREPRSEADLNQGRVGARGSFAGNGEVDRTRRGPR